MRLISFTVFLIFTILPIQGSVIIVPSILELISCSDVILTGRVERRDENTLFIQADSIFYGKCDKEIKALGHSKDWYMDSIRCVYYLSRQANGELSIIYKKYLRYGNKISVRMEQGYKKTSVKNFMDAISGFDSVFYSANCEEIRNIKEGEKNFVIKDQKAFAAFKRKSGFHRKLANEAINYEKLMVQF